MQREWGLSDFWSPRYFQGKHNHPRQIILLNHWMMRDRGHRYMEASVWYIKSLKIIAYRRVDLDKWAILCLCLVRSVSCFPVIFIFLGQPKNQFGFPYCHFIFVNTSGEILVGSLVEYTLSESAWLGYKWLEIKWIMANVIAQRLRLCLYRNFIACFDVCIKELSWLYPLFNLD